MIVVWIATQYKNDSKGKIFSIDSKQYSAVLRIEKYAKDFYPGEELRHSLLSTEDTAEISRQHFTLGNSKFELIGRMVESFADSYQLNKSALEPDWVEYNKSG